MKINIVWDNPFPLSGKIYGFVGAELFCIILNASKTRIVGKETPKVNPPKYEVKLSPPYILKSDGINVSELNYSYHSLETAKEIAEILLNKLTKKTS